MSTAAPLLAGPAEGRLLVLAAPISFWGGVDADTSAISELTHPDHGLCLAGAILWVPELKGSGGTPGAIASLIRAGLGPAAILMPKGDANLLAGLIVSQRLYDVTVPYCLAPKPPQGTHLRIGADGTFHALSA